MQQQEEGEHWCIRNLIKKREGLVSKIMKTGFENKHLMNDLFSLHDTSHHIIIIITDDYYSLTLKSH